jgi:hypothetical protein
MAIYSAIHLDGRNEIFQELHDNRMQSDAAKAAPLMGSVSLKINVHYS